MSEPAFGPEPHTRPLSRISTDDGSLENLWIGDCSGWEIYPANEGFLRFNHRCGFELLIPGFFLGNVLAQWFDRGKHTC